MRDFVNARDWNQFHTPRNLVLALSGECGELSEIFQWRGITRPSNILEYSRKELIHIGEEISDVFIYNLRLSDLGGIDIARVVSDILSENYDISENTDYRSANGLWSDMDFAGLISTIRSPGNTYHQLGKKDPRALILQISAKVGEIGGIFAEYSEEQGAELGLLSFSAHHTKALAQAMGRIAILLTTLAVVCNLNIGTCLNDKLAKNSAKYPAELVKGSSAKYTAYSSGTWPIRMLIALPTRLRSILCLPDWFTSKRVILVAGTTLLASVCGLFVIDMLAMIQLGGYPQGDIVSTSQMVTITKRRG